MNILFLILNLILTGCAIPFKEEDGTKYHLIVGVGLIAVNDNKSKAATVTNSQVVGVSVSDQPELKFAVGYSSNRTVSLYGNINNVFLGVADSSQGDISIDFSHMKVNHQRKKNNDKE